jgi:hypothetical protein
MYLSSAKVFGVEKNGGGKNRWRNKKFVKKSLIYDIRKQNLEFF